MVDAVFREKAEPQREVEPKNSVAVERVHDVEPPFTEYRKVNKKPFTADYFNLGDLWEDKIGGFKEEVDLLENYIAGLVESGKMENSNDAARAFYKKAEKMCQADRTDRNVIKIAKMAAYVKFLRETDNINSNSQKYAHS